MKVFITDKRQKGYVSETDFHWCDDGELLMFGQFQLDGNPSAVSMCGVSSRKYTTHIFVADMEIDRDFYKEIITESVEKSMDCVIQENGDYEVTVGFTMAFNINDIVDELLHKSDKFKHGQKVKCVGRELVPIF